MGLPEEYVLVIGTGSVEACNLPGMCYCVSAECGLPVIVVLTRQARRFVTEDSLRFVGGASLVATDDSESLGELPNHVLLLQGAVAVVVYPACLDFIGKIASGLAPDLASTIVAGSFQKTLAIVPSMNESMWQNPFLCVSINKLREVGVAFHPKCEHLAPSVPDVAAWVRTLIEPGRREIKDYSDD